MYLCFDSVQSNLSFELLFVRIHQALRETWLLEHKKLEILAKFESLRVSNLSTNCS